MPAFAIESGSAPSNTPCGQRYLQKKWVPHSQLVRHQYRKQNNENQKNSIFDKPITLSCRDKDLCLLADTLNQSLEQLRAMQHCFKQGNTQLQAAITSISHDLRTPLTAICGYLELLEKEPLSATSLQYVAIIRERTDVMTQLTEELFRYSVVLSVPLAQSLQEVSVNRILEGSIAAMYAVLKRHRITPDITMTDRTWAFIARALVEQMHGQMNAAYEAGRLVIRMQI